MKQHRLKIKEISWFFYFFMIFSQITLIFVFRGNQFSDYSEYLELAREIAANHSFYPRPEDLYGLWVHGLGYVNLLALLFRVNDNIQYAYILNMVFIQIMFYSGAHILRKLNGNNNQVDIFRSIFCIYFSIGSGLGLVTLINTELCFSALAIMGFACLCINIRGKYVVAGILLALANWVRPTAIIYIIASLLLLYINLRERKVKKYLQFLAGFCVTIILIGGAGKLSCGKFVYQSVSSGINLMQGANPIADGNNKLDFLYNESAGGGIVPNGELTCFEINDIYFKRAVQWIFTHPQDYIGLIPNKLFYLFALDTYGSTAFYNNEVMTDTTEYIIELQGKLFHDFSSLSFADILTVAGQIYYMLIMVLFFLSLCYAIKNKEIIKWIAVYSITIVGSGMIALIFGYARYKTSFWVAILMMSAYALEKLGLSIYKRRICRKL